MTEAASAVSPALATITTRSAVLTSSISLMVRPARSLSQAFIDQSAPACGGLSKCTEAKNDALFHSPSASFFTTASLRLSSAMTLIARGLEFGALMRNLASSAVVIRALSLSITHSPLEQADSITCSPQPIDPDQTEACPTPVRTVSASLAPSLNGCCGGSTTEAERTW